MVGAVNAIIADEDELALKFLERCKGLKETKKHSQILTAVVKKKSKTDNVIK